MACRLVGYQISVFIWLVIKYLFSYGWLSNICLHMVGYQISVFIWLVIKYLFAYGWLSNTCNCNDKQLCNAVNNINKSSKIVHCLFIVPLNLNNCVKHALTMSYELTPYECAYNYALLIRWCFFFHVNVNKIPLARGLSVKPFLSSAHETRKTVIC